MTDHPQSERAPVGFPHLVLDRLTVMKIHLGSLRQHLHQGDMTPDDIETHLARIEQEIDATAALAQDMQDHRITVGLAQPPGAPWCESDPDRR